MKNWQPPPGFEPGPPAYSLPSLAQYIVTIALSSTNSTRYVTIVLLVITQAMG